MVDILITLGKQLEEMKIAPHKGHCDKLLDWVSNKGLESTIPDLMAFLANPEKKLGGAHTVEQTLSEWSRKHTGKWQWLTLCHGTVYEEPILPAPFHNSAFFTVDCDATCSPDTVLNITTQMELLPSAYFDGVILMYCPTPTIIAIYTQLERVVKRDGYWLSMEGWLSCASTNVLTQLSSSEHERRNGPHSDHFYVPYEFEYCVPIAYRSLFADFERKVVGLPDTEKLTIFVDIFKMTPEQLGILEPCPAKGFRD